MIEDKSKFVNYSNKAMTYYVEHAKICVDNGQVTAYKKDGSESIPIQLYSSITLGPGTSITNEAAKVINKRECVIIFSGGVGIPTYGYSSNYRSPIHKIKQYKSTTNYRHRLKVAKLLMYERNITCSICGLPALPERELSASGDIQNILLVEARWVKAMIRHLCAKYNMPLDRNRLKLLNHFSYSLVVPSIIHFGLDPNIGILHGENRGGGLVFDLADIFKPALSLELSFLVASDATAGKLKHAFIERAQEIKFQKRIIKFLEDVIIC
jgi:CRISPR-associated protein Cas1